MGKQFHIETRTMKFLVVLALVAAAYAAPEAEANADPAYFYGNYYGYPSYYSGYGYSGYAYWKREAGAEPEAKADASADPAYWYGNYGWGSPYYNTDGGMSVITVGEVGDTVIVGDVIHTVDAKDVH